MPATGARNDGDAAERVNLTLAQRTELYALGRFLQRETRARLALRIPFDVYFKDPLVGRTMNGVDINKGFLVPWEPGIGDGPTSARFAVVDFDSSTGVLAPPARWDRDRNQFTDPEGRPVDMTTRDTPQFRQVSTWAIVQNTLDIFESPFGLGRRILWGFEGNRLIVVPHAGIGQNAYYDRKSKSLQFYYFDSEGGTISTCLSSDIVNHEFGHAVLDGIRPYYLEGVSPQTGAFHEFLGDLTAILMALRDKGFRNWLAANTKGDLEGHTLLADLAGEFGDAVEGRPYLRSAANDLTMSDMEGELRPHTLSQVMTGAMFDIVVALSRQYLDRNLTQGKKISAAEALWYTTQRMQEIAIQPLDLLPPVEVTFSDYAHAVLRNHALVDPIDSESYRAMMIEIFRKRGILADAEADELLRPQDVNVRQPGDVYHNPDVLAGSRAEAYRYLDDNRDDLFIPPGVDLTVSEIFTARKMSPGGLRRPRQVLIQYVWREELTLSGNRFGRFEGQTTSMLCGATLALDENGSLLAWARKPGGTPTATASRALAKQAKGSALSKTDTAALAERDAGIARQGAYLDALSRRIQAGMVGEINGSSAGLLAKAIPPFTARTEDGVLRFELAPHFDVPDGHLDHGGHQPNSTGERQWQTSS